MTRKRIRKDFHRTAADHRPMIPELRRPDDILDVAVREVRQRFDEINPEHKQKWR